MVIPYVSSISSISFISPISSGSFFYVNVTTVLQSDLPSFLCLYFLVIFIDSLAISTSFLHSINNSYIFFRCYISIVISHTYYIYIYISLIHSTLSSFPTQVYYSHKRNCYFQHYSTIPVLDSLLLAYFRSLFLP